MNDNGQNAYYEDGEAGENLHESRLVRFSYREFIRWIAVLALFVVSLLVLVNTNSDVKIITSEPDYKREFLFSIVLSFIEIVLINTTFFILAYAAPGVFKSLLRKKTRKMSHVPDPDRSERILGNDICIIYALLFLAVLMVAGVEGRYSGMNYWALWGRFLIIMLPIALWNDFILSGFVFTKTNFYEKWSRLASGVEPGEKIPGVQWTNRKRKNLFFTPVDALLLALLFWFII